MDTVKTLDRWSAKFPRERGEDEPPLGLTLGIFGVPLAESIKYANVSIYLLDHEGEILEGRIPTVVAKCAMFLEEQAMGTEGIFRIDTSTERTKEFMKLQKSFDWPPRFGKDLDWNGYTVHDAATILIKYLKSLPNGVVPLKYFKRLTECFKNTTASDQKAMIEKFQQIIIDIPALYRRLLLYMLDFMSCFASNSDKNLTTSKILAIIFQPGLISYGNMTPEVLTLSQLILEFLIDNSSSFVLSKTTLYNPKEQPTSYKYTNTIASGVPVSPRTHPGSVVSQQERQAPLSEWLNNMDITSQPQSTPPTIGASKPDLAFSSELSVVQDKPLNSIMDQNRPASAFLESVFANWNRSTPEIIESTPTPPSQTTELSAWNNPIIPSINTSPLELTPSLISSAAIDEARAGSSANSTDDIISIHNNEGLIPENIALQNPDMLSNSTHLANDEDVTVIPVQNQPPIVRKTAEQDHGISGIADDNELPEDALEVLFKDHLDNDAIFTESEISLIASALKTQHPKWKLVPRLYIILRTIGCLEYIDTIVRSGFSDYELPVNDRGVPSHLSAEYHPHFLTAQKLVLTRNVDLEQGGAGKHHHFRVEDSFPFEFRERLGAGGFGEVDRVCSLTSGKEFALKRFRRGTFSTAKGMAGLRGIIAEIEILKSLSHKHIVKFVGSYTDRKFLGLIMTPVAESDLMLYLMQAVPIQYPTLRSFFGCLTAGLEYLHGKLIRHKDIKPGNILVQRGNVLLTDFGLARDFGTEDGSTTTGSVNGTSVRYAAPEVLLMESRNTKSDIWSLGIVFLEILVVLKGRNNEWLDDYMLSHGLENRFVRMNREGFTELLAELQNLGTKSDNIVLDWISLMLHEHHTRRPTATSLLQKIVSPDEDDDYGPRGSFCGLCCRYDDDSSSTDSE